MNRKLFLSITIFLATNFPFHLINSAEKPIKILVLIIASDNLPVYEKLEKIWRCYMHYNPAQIETYFVRCNPNLKSDFEVKYDVILVRSEDNIIPGITNKRIKAMEIMISRIDEFDYILHTNLSSFYIFPRLLNFLEDQPREKFYSAGAEIVAGLGSGSGFILTPDLVKLLVKNKNFFWNNTVSYDDVLFGYFLKHESIPLILHKRIDSNTIDDWFKNKDNIPSDVFQFRIKTPPTTRIIDDIYIQLQLIKIFYDKEIKLSGETISN